MPRSPKGKQAASSSSAVPPPSRIPSSTPVVSSRISSSVSVVPYRITSSVSAVPYRITSSTPEVSSSVSAVPYRITSTTVLPPRLSAVPPSLSSDSSKLPPRKSALKAKEYIKNHIDNGISSSDDDEDWKFDEEGIDESLAENLHDFFKQQKKTTDVTKKKIYTYLFNTMDKKNDDGNDSTKLGIDSILPSLNADLRAYYKEEGFDETPPSITRNLLDKYLDHGIDDDDYEEDGWILKDE